ncbi:MAG: trypsin-like peptidase domain-containing protein, partial [Candidatus Wildermuthbacteria bacterium]|nr:trypsin-like peptidase domain-containing protein [Candidatus Wildermuthbacteria bacterium]
VVKKVSPAVVSIVITKDVPVFEQSFEDFGPFEIPLPQFRQKGTEKQETGRGSGFFVSADGTIVTNKHVVVDKNSEYTVFTVSGKSYKANVLARDPVQDVAILKISQDQKFDAKGNLLLQPFPYVALGNSSALEIGQSVIAIGNALGEFRNTVSVGVISGLGRTITAASGGFVETIYDVIQTDAAINQGNSGGPLLNLAGEVIGVNTATVLNAQNIGFAVPVRVVVKDLEQVKTFGSISSPFIGVRYAMIDEKVKSEENLPVDNGALIAKGKQGEPAITPKSPAEKAGLKEGDIILELNGEKITLDNTLAKVIQKYNPGDLVTLKILRGGKDLTLSLTLGSRNE